MLSLFHNCSSKEGLSENEDRILPSTPASSSTSTAFQDSTIPRRQGKRKKLLNLGLAVLLSLDRCTRTSALLSSLLPHHSTPLNALKYEKMKISRIYAPRVPTFLPLKRYFACNSDSKRNNGKNYSKTNKDFKGFPLFQSTESKNVFCQSTLVGSTLESTKKNPSSSIHVTNNIIHPMKNNELNQSFSSSTLSQQQQQQLQSDNFETLFSLDLPEGKCVGLRLLPTHYQTPNNPTSLSPSQIESNNDHWIKKILHPEEVKFSIGLPSESAQSTFFIGRLAMRAALMLFSRCDTKNNGATKDGIVKQYQQQCNGVDIIDCEDRKFGGFIKLKLPAVSRTEPSILKDQHGRPQVPKGYIGSISHKKTTGVALVTSVPLPSDDSTTSRPKIGIGVDIEQTFSRRRSIAKKILTSNELANLGQLKTVTRDEEVLLRFSLKECVYKAMHPIISQWVGFQEAEIQPHDDGTATVTLNLKSGAHEEFKTVKAHWRRIDGDFFLTSSKVTLK